MTMRNLRRILSARLLLEYCTAMRELKEFWAVTKLMEIRKSLLEVLVEVPTAWKELKDWLGVTELWDQVDQKRQNEKPSVLKRKVLPGRLAERVRSGLKVKVDQRVALVHWGNPVQKAPEAPCRE